ncbi:MAG: CocE/NonD family hydrolase, partial [Microlunatus sp.]|nr:CocE/NonD family hydrolase [Microlunatus sp.]
MRVRQIDIAADSVIVRDLWIPMPDGIRLHARAWLPADVDQTPAPVLLEYLPYRLDDWTSLRDSERHPYYALHGYCSVRVDIRGTGSSEGHFDDEYSEQELDDAEAVIDWLSDEPWCTGRVGMFGISWGGFNALQVAQRGPKALHAIVTVCSSDDRYGNDVHYFGGAVLGVDMAAWAATMFAFGSRPPRPEVVGDDWIEQWRSRLDDIVPLAPIWLAHQARDDYWRRGSVCEDYSGVRAAVLAVGGWADPYRDTVLRLLENLRSPRKGIIGPWSHHYPDRERAAPGPQIGFLQETLRWWDRWLKDEDTGVESDPDLRAWINHEARPATYVEEQSGRWLAIPEWTTAPSTVSWSLDRAENLGGRTMLRVRSPWDTGQDAGRYFPFGNDADLPPDQRAEDGRSICLDLPVGAAPRTVLGCPTLRVQVASDGPHGTLIARLCEVAPDGTSTLITRGALNLARRRGMDRNDPMPPDLAEWVEVRLVAVGHQFSPGNTIRLALSNHYWPWIWPHQDDAAFTVHLDGAVLKLPEAPADGPPVRFEAAEHARPLEVTYPSPEPPVPEGDSP